MPGQAAPTDPLVALWADRQRLLAAWLEEDDLNGDGNFNTPECHRLDRKRWDAEESLCTTPARTIERLVALLEYARTEFDDAFSDAWSVPYTSIFDTLLAGAKALAGVA